MAPSPPRSSGKLCRGPIAQLSFSRRRISSARSIGISLWLPPCLVRVRTSGRPRLMPLRRCVAMGKKARACLNFLPVACGLLPLWREVCRGSLLSTTSAELCRCMEVRPIESSPVQLCSFRPKPYTSRVEYRPLEGFVLAVSPFNFTAIGGNLPGSSYRHFFLLPLRFAHCCR
jgi:hypothetical protein